MNELLNAQYQLRSTLVDDLRSDLFGPSDDLQEVIADPPVTRYALGILFPQEAEFDAASDVDEQDEGEEGAMPDPGVALAAARRPASCGVTFAVDPRRCERIELSSRASRYVPCDESGRPLEDVEPADRSLLTGHWLRKPLELPPQLLDLRPRDHRLDLVAGLQLYVRVRPADRTGAVAVTAVLLNTTGRGPNHLTDIASFFQVGLSVRDASGSACFVERRLPSALIDDEELRSYDLLYRHARSYAVGHGCSAAWNRPDGEDNADRIEIDFCPSVPVNLAESNAAITSAALSMRFCAEAPLEELASALGEIVDGYQSWVSSLRSALPTLDRRHHEAAQRHLEQCEEVAARLRQGIDHVREDPASLKAFRLANEAMRTVRARTDWLRTGRPGDGPAADADGQWRPFQLAFILMCLVGVADPRHPDRDVADLLWFPTGGGKTEAYLGLIAFTILRRRDARDVDAAGVTVIMRYTLRLLTIQQFARAALLIAACEHLRRSQPGLGDDPIALGLWVGRGATPNTRAETRTSLNLLKQGLEPTEGNPKQLQSCPWCGTGLRTDHHFLADHPPRLAIACRNRECDFATGLPVYVVDEDIYDHRPSLVIATADKFASLPWNPRTRALFGGEQGDAPPDLIIQDELHLISGPLGTLAGLYETAIDHLCEVDGVRPKVVASTATIRRAGKQVEALFDRSMRQFPPPGLDARDSYFAVEAPPELRGNRLYMGLMAPATSQTTLMVRTYARLLATAEVTEHADDVVDPYWTLLGYFNSLRVLGGALMQVQDDVVDRLKLLLGRETSRHMEPIEMTSRIGSGEIPKHLARMERRRPDEEALDVVLATNMISVGVDVDRLGLMAVMGQPQATAEYIQATSRVGRRHPGLVVVLFNAARSRDRSHYEAFAGYHGALYRQVESTSVTPFASRARDRGLHAVFVALCRLTIPGLRDEESAGAIGDHVASAEAVVERILERVARVDAPQVEATRAELENVLSQWIDRAARIADLRYRDVRKPHRALLVDAAGDPEFGALPTLYSLRDVDLESSLKLV